MIKAAVSGSFHRHMPAIYAAVGDLCALGVNVLSPSDPRVVDFIGDFLFVASDKLRSIKLVQDRHLEAIRAADFLWVVCPDGYTGPSTCMEVGAAHIAGVPVFSSAPALDITVGEYVHRVRSYQEAIDLVSERNRSKRMPTNVLIDPHTSVERAIDTLTSLRSSLLGRTGNGRDDAERSLSEAKTVFRDTFGPH